jgi:hypothetical protein
VGILGYAGKIRAKIAESTAAKEKENLSRVPFEFGNPGNSFKSKHLMGSGKYFIFKDASTDGRRCSFHIIDPISPRKSMLSVSISNGRDLSVSVEPYSVPFKKAFAPTHLAYDEVRNVLADEISKHTGGNAEKLREDLMKQIVMGSLKQARSDRLVQDIGLWNRNLLPRDDEFQEVLRKRVCSEKDLGAEAEKIAAKLERKLKKQA